MLKPGGKTQPSAGSVLLVTGPAGSPSRLLPACLRTYGILSVDTVEAADLMSFASTGRWSVGLIADDAARSLNETLLRRLRECCGCVYVEEASTGVGTRALGLERIEIELPSSVALAPGETREALADLLAGYLDPGAIDLAPITYDGRALDPAAGTAGAFRTSGGSVEARVYARGAGESLVASSGNLLVSTVPFLRLFVDGFRVPRLRDAVRGFGGARNREALELSLIHMWAETAAAHGLPLVSVDPWPYGVRHVLTLRQDYDRPVPDSHWRQVLEWQQGIGLRASWYYLGANVDREKMGELRARSHEVGFHYRDLSRYGKADLDAVRAAVPGAQVRGATCHGGNFYGADDVLWLAREGMSYAEHLGRCSIHPYRGIVEDRVVEELVLTARHVSVDQSVTPPRADLAYLLRTQPARARLRGHTVIMNHPDINFAETQEAVRTCTTPGTEYWTQAETAAWWEGSHVRAEFRCARGSPGGSVTMELTHAAARQPVARVWAPVEGLAAVADESFGRLHTLFALDRFTFTAGQAARDIRTA